MAMKKHTKAAAMPQNCITASQQALRDTWRSLWEQHVEWTRMTILSAVFNLPNLADTTARLLQNPADMAAALRPVYGDAASNQFAQLIRTHLLIATRLVAAAKSGDTAAAAQAEREWYANGAEVAAAVASINPYISQNAFQDKFFRHLALTKAEAVLMLAGDYRGSIATYDQIEREALMMADMISDGVIRQHPELFA